MNKAITLAVVFGSSLIAHHAFADDAADAYKRGQDAMKAGRVHEACGAFEESEKAAAKADTELALAACYEQDGKPVAAAKLYRGLADNDPNKDRRKTSADKATKLEAKAPKLRLTLSQRPDGLVIKVDGVVVPNTGDIMVDAGPHEVVATAPGFMGHANAAVDKDRAIVDVIVRLEPVAEATPPAPTPTPTPTPTTTTAPAPSTTATTESSSMTQMQSPPPPSEGGGDHHKRNGAILGGVGVAALITAVVFYTAGSSDFDDEHQLCPGSKCASQGDLNTAHSELDSGHTDRGVAIGTGIAGLVLVGAGAYLFATAPKEAQHVAITVDHGRAGISFSGHF